MANLRDGLVFNLAHSITELVKAKRRYDVALAKIIGVNTSDLRCLEEISDLRAPLPSMLAEELGLTRSAISSMLARLTSAGLVEKFEFDFDGRSHGITLTPKAQEHMWRAWSPFRTSHAECLERYTDQELQKILSYMESLIGQHDRLREAFVRRESAEQTSA